MANLDVVVIGGGPAGSTAAILLARRGWRVAVVERRGFPRRKVCGEYLSITNWPLLSALGLADAFAELAGPDVERVGLAVGRWLLRANLPRPAGAPDAWGRALSREHLDTLLLRAAADAGAEVWQPADCLTIERAATGFACTVEQRETQQTHVLRAPVVIAAHGSWETGELNTQARPAGPRSDDLFGFKVHFRDAGLEPGLMPLICFPGGYGGLVHAEAGRTSLSCCIRRDQLQRLTRDGKSAGASVLEHILATTSSLRSVLERAEPDGAWLAAGPIRPGIRSCYRDGLFFVGNAAGEAHPAVAEGITMAMQSAWLLAHALEPAKAEIDQAGVRDRVGAAYGRAWRQAFAGRIHMSEAVAQWAMRPQVVQAAAPLLRTWPQLLTLGARLAGKSKQVVSHQGGAR